ncbi:MAG: NFACT RNA binding domain-containing protein [Bacillota bacterium]
MPFDGVLAKCIANELNDELTQGRIEKVFMPEKLELVFSIRTRVGNCKLLINVNPSFARVHLTTMKKENPNTPPMFCMLLRKHLTGGRILSVTSQEFERVIIFEIESANELGDLSVKKIVVEIMGKHSNVVLLNSQSIIIDSLIHVDSDMSSKREIMPARNYEIPPSQGKVSIDMFEEIDFKKLTDESEEKLEKILLNSIQGFSPSLAKEICVRSEFKVENFPLVLNQIRLEIKEDRLFPAVYFSDSNEENLVDFHCIKLTHKQSFLKQDSINHALDYYFNRKIFIEKLAQSKLSLVKIVSSNQDRCVKKLSLQQKSVEDSRNFDFNRMIGDILNANINSIPKGAKKVDLPNFYSEAEENISIEIDDQLSPQRNAQKYYTKYSKAKKTFEHSTAQVGETILELEYLETIEEEISRSKTFVELSDIREELVSQKYISPPKIKGKKREEIESPPEEYISSDGFKIFSGKNNRQNDLLTLKSSKGDDVWFHTQKIPGSHVIIRTAGKNVPARTLEEAATISAWHSRARNSTKVPVDYTFVRNVRKPHGAKPGMVIYDTFKTMFVSPDENIVKKLMVTR